MDSADGGQIMEPNSAAPNQRRPAGHSPPRLWHGRLAAALIAAVSSLSLTGPGEAAGNGGARQVYRPGGMTLGDTVRALGHDPRAVAGCLLAGETGIAGAGDHAGDHDGASAGRAELSRLFGIIGASATGRAVLERARRRGVHVCIDRETDLLAYYFAGRRIAGVKAALPQGGKIAFLAHELAHVPQHPAYSDNRYYPPADLILLRRVREAAAEAVAIRIAWELREGGYEAAWNAKLTTAYADMARAFARAADAGGRANLRRPTRAAFDLWFEAPWRRNAYDRMTLAHLARISQDRLGLVPPREALSHDFLAAINRAEGRDFLAETGTRPLTGPAYGGGMSDDNARILARYNARIGVSAGPFRSVPVATMSP
jgi:hypothetical protein